MSKTIKSEWDEFKDNVMVGAPAPFLDIARIAFYSGTIAYTHMEHSMMNNVPEAEAVLTMAGWAQEQNAFIDEMNPSRQIITHKDTGHA